MSWRRLFDTLKPELHTYVHESIHKDLFTNLTLNVCAKIDFGVEIKRTFEAPEVSLRDRVLRLVDAVEALPGDEEKLVFLTILINYEGDHNLARRIRSVIKEHFCGILRLIEDDPSGAAKLEIVTEQSTSSIHQRQTSIEGVTITELRSDYIEIPIDSELLPTPAIEGGTMEYSLKNSTPSGNTTSPPEKKSLLDPGQEEIKNHSGLASTNCFNYKLQITKKEIGFLVAMFLIFLFIVLHTCLQISSGESVNATTTSPITTQIPKRYQNGSLELDFVERNANFTETGVLNSSLVASTFPPTDSLATEYANANNSLSPSPNENITHKPPFTQLESPLTPSTSSVPVTLSYPRKKRRKKYVKVDTLKSYQQFMSNASSNEENLVSINVRNPLEWLHGTELTKADMIDRLVIGGNLYVDVLLDVFLKKTVNANHIKLKGVNDTLCSWNFGEGISLLKGVYDIVHLNYTQKLTFHNFQSSRTSIYKAFAEKVIMPNLRGIKLSKSVIDSKNIWYVREIFKKNSHSLTHINMKGTVTTGQTLFDFDLARLTEVESVIIDNPSSFVGNDFCEVVPNVEQFISERGWLAAERMKNFFNCRKLKEFKLPIYLESQIFDFSFISRFYPNMRKVEVELSHKKCSDPKRTQFEKVIRLEGMQTLTDALSDFNVTSNCRLLFDVPTSTGHSKRVALRFKVGQLFAMSYSIKDEQRVIA